MRRKCARGYNSRRIGTSIRPTRTASAATANRPSMKRVFNHPPESATGKKYWRSLGQLSDSPEFQGWMEREFPQGAAEFQGGEVSRRNFLQLMGASAALAGL